MTLIRTAIDCAVSLPAPCGLTTAACSIILRLCILTEAVYAESLEAVNENFESLMSGLRSCGLECAVLSDGLAVIQMINPKFNPGLFGNLNTADQVLTVIEDLYGKIPQTRESKLLEAQDRSVAESIAMNSTLYQFADQADDETHVDWFFEKIELELHDTIFRVNDATSNNVPEIFVRTSSVVIFLSGRRAFKPRSHSSEPNSRARSSLHAGSSSSSCGVFWTR